MLSRLVGLRPQAALGCSSKGNQFLAAPRRQFGGFACQTGKTGKFSQVETAGITIHTKQPIGLIGAGCISGTSRSHPLSGVGWSASPEGKKNDSTPQITSTVRRATWSVVSDGQQHWLWISILQWHVNSRLRKRDLQQFNLLANIAADSRQRHSAGGTWPWLRSAA